MEQQHQLKVVESRLEWTPKYLDIVAGVFVTSVLVSNIAAQKLFAFGPATFTAGILVFPISYIFGDVLTEVYGFNRARRVIYLGMLANVFMAGVLWLAVQLPPAPGWPLQEQFAAVLGFLPRIVLASIAGYVAGELANSLIMSKLKVLTSGRHLWVRTISSTIAGQLVDTVVFALIAFLGVIPETTLLAAIISGWLFKVAYEAAATPFTYLVVNYLKRLEGVEHFDKKDRLQVMRF
jgi:uncharacterized integral membrane protein (TIGR00697 family)